MLKSNARHIHEEHKHYWSRYVSLFLYFICFSYFFCFLPVSQEANLQCNSKAGCQVVFIKPKGFRFPIKACVQV